MKIVTNQIHLLQILLLSLAVGSAFLGLIFFGQDITFWPNNWGYIEHNALQYPVVLGVVPITHFTFFMSYLLLYLTFEFYGFKNGFYGVIGITATLTAAYFLFEGSRWLSLHEKINVLPVAVLGFLHHDRFHICLLLLCFAIGGMTGFILASIIRKITGGYFMFLRYPFSSATGLTIFTLGYSYLTSGAATPEERLLSEATPAIQMVMGVVATLIPLYFIRLIFGIFKGRSSGVEEEITPAITARIPSVTPGQFNEDITASQKIHRDQIAV